MTERRMSLSAALTTAALALCWAPAARAADKPPGKAGKRNIWREIKPRVLAASKAGDRKALEKEWTSTTTRDFAAQVARETRKTR